MSPDRPNLEQARKRAKELLAQAQAGDPAALARLVRRDRPPRLVDAQLTIARELGYPNWTALVSAVGAPPGARGDEPGELARLLELLHTSRRRWNSLYAQGTTWSDPILSREAFLRGTPEGATVTTRGTPDTVQQEHRWEVWVIPPDRARCESEGPHGGMITVSDGRRQWSSMPWGRSVVGESAQDAASTLGVPTLLLHTSAIAADFDLELKGSALVAGRRALAVTGRPGPVGLERRRIVPFRGADDVELVVDAERGVLLSVTANFGGAPFFCVRIEQAVFDSDIDPGLFAISDGDEPPPPAVMGGTRAGHVGAPPEDVLGQPVAVTGNAVRTASAVVAVEQVIAYPSGFEFGLTIRMRPSEELSEPPPPGALRLGVVFSDGRFGTAGPAHDRGPVLVELLGGAATGLRLDQRVWVPELPPPGKLEIVVSRPGGGIEETRITVSADLIREAAARTQRLWDA